MCRGRRRWVAGFALVAGAVLVLGSCGSDGDDPVTPDDDSELVDLLEPLFDSEFRGAALNLQLPNGPDGCLEITPVPWSDDDGDNVPNQVTFTFDEEGCAFTFPGGGGTTAGTIEVTDPGVPFGYQAELTDLMQRFTDGNPPTTTTRTTNGTQTVSGAATGATMVRNVTSTIQKTGRATATAVLNLTVQYTPDAGGQILFGVGTPLPPGAMTMTGTVALSVPGRAVTLEIATATPLIRGGTCDFGGPESGEIHVTVVSGADPGYLAIVFEGCDVSVEWYPD